MHSVNHGWLYGTVKPYFASQGITLLKDDMHFIANCLGSIPYDRHRFVMRDYLAIWNTKVAEKESASSMPINARFEANVYLRNAAGLN